MKQSSSPHQSLVLHDPRDPLSRALERLFKERADRPCVRKRVRKELVPMVTNMAVKIGGIDSETAVRDRALATTVGVIGIYLSSIRAPRNADITLVWAQEVEQHGLLILFRKGYGLLKQVFDLSEIDVSFGSWVHRASLGTGSNRLESDEAARMERIARAQKNGAWHGYGEFLDELAYRTDEHVASEFGLWLVREAGAERDVIEHADLYQEVHLFVERVIMNLMHTGKLKNGLDYVSLRAIVKEARGNKAWHERAQRRYRAFLKKVPRQFQFHFEKGKSLDRMLGYFFQTVEELRKGRRSLSYLTTSFCAHMGILSPGFKERLEREG